MILQVIHRTKVCLFCCFVVVVVTELLYLLLSSGAGFKCSEHENPADYFLDMLTYCEKRSLAGQLEGEVVEDTGTCSLRDVCGGLLE